MIRNFFGIGTFAVMLTVLIVSGCNSTGNSSSSNSVTSPRITSPGSFSETRSDSSGQHALWGFWWIHVDPGSDSFEIVPSREPAIHANVRKFLDDGEPCSDCIQITNITINPDGSRSVDIQLTHPWPGLDTFTGFDVRAIVMWNGSELWTESGLLTQAPDSTDGYVYNADGYTTMFNPTDFPQGSDIPIFTYSQGKFATPIPPNSTLNPYIDYYTDENRHMFRSGQSVTRTWEMRFPTGGPFMLGYAVDSSWEFPNPNPPENLPDDFSLTANKPEPYRLSVGQKELLGEVTGSETDIEVTVWDWQNNPGGVWIECPDLWSGKKNDMMVAYGPEYVIFYIPIQNETGATEGTYRALIAARDTSTSPPPWDCTTYTFFDIAVGDKCCDNPPVAVIENAVPIITGQELTLTSGSYDPDGDDCMAEVSWDLDGDGLFEHVGDEAIVSWDEIGIYPVSLKATDICALEDITTEFIEVHVGITQPEDDSYKTIGNRYSYVSAELSTPDAAFAVDMSNPDGPWDFTLLSLEDIGNYRAILGSDHPEVASFKDDFSEPYHHFYKTEGIFNMVSGTIYVVEDYALDPDHLLWVGMHEPEKLGSTDFTPVMAQPYPLWIYSAFEYYIGFLPIFEFSFSVKGWGEGEVSVPWNSITNEPCVVISYNISVSSPDVSGSVIAYEWILDDGTVVAVTAAINYEDDINFDEETGEITGIATFNALHEVVPY